MNNKEIKMNDEAVWRKLDEHTMRIDNLTVQVAETRAEFNSLEKHLNRQIKDINDTLLRIENKINIQSEYQNKTKGAIGFGAWLLSGIVGIATFVSVVWNIVFGN